MSGKNQVTAFRENFNTSVTFIGGNLDPSSIGIVGLTPDHPEYVEGVDVPLEDWNQDLWDEARLTLAQTDPIDPMRLIRTFDLGGSIDPIKVIRRRGMVLASNGRRRILAARAANRILLSEREDPDGLIALPAIVDKSSDLEVSVRTANVGRLDDPPWVSAANALRLLSRGKSVEQISVILDKQVQTINNWLLYARGLAPDLKLLIEDPTAPKGERVPFAIGVELARGTYATHDQAPGEDEYAVQRRALEHLLRERALLTGERGRENARKVVKAILSGSLEPVSETDNGADGPPPQEDATSTPSSQDEPKVEPKVEPKKGARPRDNVSVIRQNPMLSRGAVRELCARLEPSKGNPHKTEAQAVAYRLLLVVTGQDLSGDGLEQWPELHAAVRLVCHSGGTQPSLKEKERDTRRSIKCPNKDCDKGWVPKKKDTCRICDGHGYISPAKMSTLKVRK